MLQHWLKSESKSKFWALPQIPKRKESPTRLVVDRHKRSWLNTIMKQYSMVDGVSTPHVRKYEMYFHI